MTAEKNQAAIQTTMDRMISGYATQSVETIMNCYEANAAYALGPGETANGSALPALFERFLAAKPQFTFTSHEIVVADELALHMSVYAIPTEGGGVRRGLSVAVLRRQTGGSWLMVIDHPAGHRLLQ